MESVKLVFLFLYWVVFFLEIAFFISTGPVGTKVSVGCSTIATSLTFGSVFVSGITKFYTFSELSNIFISLNIKVPLCPIDNIPFTILNTHMVLTMPDLDEIRKIFNEMFDEKFGLLPTKDEFFTKMDEVMGELKAIREEHSMLSARVFDDLEPRVEKIEKKIGLQTAP